MDYSSLGDETLLLLITREHSGALDELYHRYSRLVFGLALKLVGDRATAEEITLDVFTRVWQKSNTYRADRAKVSTWLISITRYQSIDVLRRRGARPDYQSLDWADASSLSDSRHNPEHLTEVAIQRERMLAAIRQLPDEQEHALRLAYFAGFTHRQIADLLEQPLGTVKTRIRLAMQKLRRMLAE